MDYEPVTLTATQAGIKYTREFTIEMSGLSIAKPHSYITATSSYSISTTPRPTRFTRDNSESRRWANTIPLVPGISITSRRNGYGTNDETSDPKQTGNIFYDLGAAINDPGSALVRKLKSRHLQMIAIGGSIGTGLFVSSGLALYQGGPVSMLLAYITTGMFQFCTMQSLAELVVTFPIAGSFSVFSTRFLDPSWGFAMGWNYALQWLFILPLEVIACALTIQYWNQFLSPAIFVTLFLLVIAVINLMGIKAYGEAEFLFSTIKVTAIIGFILLGILINIGGAPNGGYIGGKYWVDPGPINHGLKGFCSVLATSSFSFGGTELIGLAAAEATNPTKSLPNAIKQVFWRIAIFYIVSLLLVSLLVPYNDPSLVGGATGDSQVSPFVSAIETAGQTILPSVMNGVILVAALSVGNSAVFGSSRTLASLADQSHAPRAFSYVDRKGRPLVATLFALGLGLLAYLATVKIHQQIFDWLFATCGLSSLFTWGSICLCHIRFRRAWAHAGYRLDQLPYRSQVGVIGSVTGLVGNLIVLGSQFWVAISPITSSGVNLTPAGTAKSFFLKVMAVPIVLMVYLTHKLWLRTRVVSVKSMDIDTGRTFLRAPARSAEEEDRRRAWPFWKRLYRVLFLP
ncbi:hypothetical protein Purlil1_12847 [Purpureocillium lilacinum]|uniref:Amino acid permease/ SLC12A domain-containing protein n=1 Tax=Purpureocillium lilacinum TaxID=33203 RepID=A0ABR0BG41_PURLI|nr:hypothetical protein Purlil1_12847 [Purpureocillium lilacinum]